MQRLRDLSKKLPQAAKGANGTAKAQKKPFDPPKESPMEKIVLEDLGATLKMCRVDKGGYLASVPDNKVGHFYSGDSYVIFCKYEVRSRFLQLFVALHFVWRKMSNFFFFLFVCYVCM